MIRNDPKGSFTTKGDVKPIHHLPYSYLSLTRSRLSKTNDKPLRITRIVMKKHLHFIMVEVDEAQSRSRLCVPSHDQGFGYRSVNLVTDR
jgi:hypothetical protein